MQLPVQLRKRIPDTHKGDYGQVFVLGGSVGLTGAVCLCAQAALKAGAGIVRAGVPKSLNNIFEIKLTEVMSLPLAEAEDGYLSFNAFSQIKKITSKIDVLAVGCGAGMKISTQKLILKLIKEIDLPIVLDADGLNSLAGNLKILDKKKGSLILTPHLGEFSRLIKTDITEIKKKRKELVKEFALRYNLILVLKGYRTLISDGRTFYENMTGNPGMAAAGMGDVLTGIIAGLASQGLDNFYAAKLGVYLHGLAGDLAAKEKTETCLIASDIIEFLPKALKSFKSN